MEIYTHEVYILYIKISILLPSNTIIPTKKEDKFLNKSSIFFFLQIPRDQNTPTFIFGKDNDSMTPPPEKKKKISQI